MRRKRRRMQTSFKYILHAGCPCLFLVGWLVGWLVGCFECFASCLAHVGDGNDKMAPSASELSRRLLRALLKVRVPWRETMTPKCQSNMNTVSAIHFLSLKPPSDCHVHEVFREVGESVDPFRLHQAHEPDTDAGNLARRSQLAASHGLAFGL
jgi:hypothetical protein